MADKKINDPDFARDLLLAGQLQEMDTGYGDDVGEFLDDINPFSAADGPYEEFRDAYDDIVEALDDPEELQQQLSNMATDRLVSFALGHDALVQSAGAPSTDNDDDENARILEIARELVNRELARRNAAVNVSTKGGQAEPTPDTLGSIGDDIEGASEPVPTGKKPGNVSGGGLVTVDDLDLDDDDVTDERGDLWADRVPTGGSSGGSAQSSIDKILAIEKRANTVAGLTGCSIGGVYALIEAIDYLADVDKATLKTVLGRFS